MSWQQKRGRIHSVSTSQDARMATALGTYVTADCGYRWIPQKFAEECEGLKHCQECFPPERAARGPRFPADADAPVPHYVYRCYDSTGRLVYVGCTNNPVKRAASHSHVAWWFSQVVTTRHTVFPNRRYALMKEREAIATEMPRWNVKGKWAARSDAWTADDYYDFRHAIVQAIETTHGVYGQNTRKLLAAVDAELMRRFGVTAINRKPA